MVDDINDDEDDDDVDGCGDEGSEGDLGFVANHEDEGHNEADDNGVVYGVLVAGIVTVAAIGMAILFTMSLIIFLLWMIIQTLK